MVKAGTQRKTGKQETRKNKKGRSDLYLNIAHSVKLCLVKRCKTTRKKRLKAPTESIHDGGVFHLICDISATPTDFPKPFCHHYHLTSSR